MSLISALILNSRGYPHALTYLPSAPNPLSHEGKLVLSVVSLGFFIPILTIYSRTPKTQALNPNSYDRSNKKLHFSAEVRAAFVGGVEVAPRAGPKPPKVCQAV